MKKLTAILLVVIMLLVPSAAMAGTIEDLNAIDALPEGVTYEETSGDVALRGEFAYMVAKILNSGEIAAQNTQFSDVTVDNIYSGYIKYLAEIGIVNGTNGTSFNPDGPLEMDAAAKMLVCAMGLGSVAEELGGYPDGYNYIARRVGLYKNLSTVGGELTKYNSTVILHNALLAEVPDEFSDTKGRLLCDVLGISAYSGIITDVDVVDHSVAFRVDSNVYAQNKKNLTIEQEHKLAVDKLINVSEYERVPVTIWVDSNDVVIHIICERDTEVVYGYLLSINGDDSEDGAYPASALDELMFINNDEVYSVDEDVLVKYNNKYTTAPVELCGKFAKAVVIDKKI
ncbi:MAG: S-layer homology domain-containing protein, partial [Clostridia bacterium]|nr:S-layer homology domain-containing protein [Clostridia bacterium]